MNLIVDEGNTYVKLYLVKDNTIAGRKRFRFENSILAKKEIHAFVEEENIVMCGLASVGHHRDELAVILPEIAPTVVIDPLTPAPLKNKYKTPETLGIDRFAAAVGANFLYPGEDLLIVDIGSAITYDFVSRNGEYLGGNISPGVEFRLRALHDYTAKLPLVDPACANWNIGRSTREAIANGVLSGIVYEIDGYISDFQNNFKKLRTILTGGGANFFEKKIKNIIFVQLDLVPLGLNRILTYKRTF